MFIDGINLSKCSQVPPPPPPWHYPAKGSPPPPSKPDGKSGEVPCQHLCGGQRIYTVKDEAMMVQCYINIV